MHAYLFKHVRFYLQPARAGKGWVIGVAVPNWCDCSRYSCHQRLALPPPVNLCQGFDWLDTELTWQSFGDMCISVHQETCRNLNIESLTHKNIYARTQELSCK